jgi:hypothetical protein
MKKGVNIESELSDSVAKYVPADVQKSIERAASITHPTLSKSSAAASIIHLKSGSEEPDLRKNSEFYTNLVLKATKTRNFGLSMRFFGLLP